MLQEFYNYILSLYLYAFPPPLTLEPISEPPEQPKQSRKKNFNQRNGIIYQRLI